MEFLSGIQFYILFVSACWLLQSHTKATGVIILESALQELYHLDGTVPAINAGRMAGS